MIEAEPERVAALRTNARVLREAFDRRGLPAGGSGAQIIPVVIGDEDRAVAACGRALDDGVYAQAIRPPTVPAGTSRLRLTVMATHDPADLREAATVIADAVGSVSADGDWCIDLPDPDPGELRVVRAEAAARA